MVRLLAKSPFVLLALGLLILTCRASQSDDDEFISLNQQVHKLFEQGKYQEAIPLAEKAVELAKRVYGPEHPKTAQSLNNMAELYRVMGEYVKAEPLFKEALQIYQKVLGPEHPDTATCLNNLAGLYGAMGEYAKAEPLFKGIRPSNPWSMASPESTGFSFGPAKRWE
jgi:tetratricopeptide (TPR) repeat protein